MAMSLFCSMTCVATSLSCVSLSGGQSVVKAQVLAGGRGKGYFTSGLEGGVQKAERCACVRVCAWHV